MKAKRIAFLLVILAFIPMCIGSASAQYGKYTYVDYDVYVKNPFAYQLNDGDVLEIGNQPEGGSIMMTISEPSAAETDMLNNKGSMTTQSPQR